jgi:hypothetical protein
MAGMDRKKTLLVRVGILWSFLIARESLLYSLANPQLVQRLPVLPQRARTLGAVRHLT